MANSTSIAAVAQSVEHQLKVCFAALIADEPAAFRQIPNVAVVRSTDFEGAATSSNTIIREPTLTILCYRVDVNRTMRPPWSQVAHHDGMIHLPLDVHLLLTPFDKDASGELRILGAAMQCLEQHSILSGPALHPRGAWDATDAIQIVNEELDTEDVLRTFDTLPTSFRLSVSYLARVVRIDAPDREDRPDVRTAVRGLVPSSVPMP